MTRIPTPEELSEIEAKLAALREHLRCWPTVVGYEWDLCKFAYYEGSDRRCQECAILLKEAGPLALGRELVERHNCQWCTFDSAEESRLGVMHAALDAPIDLFALDEAPLLDPDEHDDDLEPFGPGEGAVESLYAILRRIRAAG